MVTCLEINFADFFGKGLIPKTKLLEIRSVILLFSLFRLVLDRATPVTINKYIYY